MCPFSLNNPDGQLNFAMGDSLLNFQRFIVHGSIDIKKKDMESIRKK
jgi:hypothetical protein